MHRRNNEGYYIEPKINNGPNQYHYEEVGQKVFGIEREKIG